VLSECIATITDLPDSENLPLQVSKQSIIHPECFGRAGWLNGASNESSVQLYNMYDLFAESQRHSEEQADKLHKGQQAKQAYIKQNGGVIAVTGTAGVGKTTLSKLVAHREQNNSIKYLPFIFHVLLRDVDFQKPCSVLQFLTRSMLSDWIHSEESDKALLGRINESDNVFIFVDGLDEAREISLQKRTSKMSLYDIEHPEKIFKNIFSGHLLPKAKKFLTSRPGAFYDLHQDYKPIFTVKILGLKKEHQKRLCHSFCTSPEDIKKVDDAFISNHALSSLCFVPMFCKMTAEYFLQCASQGCEVGSSTDLFVFALCKYKKAPNFTGKAEDILRISRFALNSFLRNEMIFEENALEEYGVSKTAFENFLNINILDGEKPFYFSHLLWQEFFAAFYLFFCSSLKHFVDLLPRFNENHWDSVVKFMSGFSRSEVGKKICANFPNISLSDCPSKIEYLQQIAKKCMKDYVESAIHEYPSLKETVSLFGLSQNMRRCFIQPDSILLKASAWVYEFQNQNFANEFAKSFPERLILRGSLLPVDVICLCYILGHSSRAMKISIGTWEEATYFSEEGLKLFLNKMRSTHHEVGLKQGDGRMSRILNVKIRLLRLQNLQETFSIENSTPLALTTLASLIRSRAGSFIFVIDLLC